MKKLVVLGGGIAGIEAAIQASKAGFDVELISERDYLFIYPISIWIPVSTCNFDDASLSLHTLAKRHGFHLTIDRVTAINSEHRQITLENDGIRMVDHLILATGSAKMKLPGAEHTLSICGDPLQSLDLKTRIDHLIAKGEGKIAFGFGGNPKDTSAVRGGPAFELFFNLHHRLAKLGIRDRFEMTFFAPMPKPGARMGEKALAMMDKMFASCNFKSHYGRKIKTFEYDRIIFEDNSELLSDLTMFIPAGTGASWITASNLPKNEAGFVRIDSSCRIVGMDTWYAIGDVAALEGPEWRAKQGHIAEVMAQIAVSNLAIDLLGNQEERESYFEHLNILCVMDMGNGAGLVYRDEVKAHMIPLPVIGHWLKQLWGWYYKQTKLGRFPRLPGL